MMKLLKSIILGAYVYDKLEEAIEKDYKNNKITKRKYDKLMKEVKKLEEINK